MDKKHLYGSNFLSRELSLMSQLKTLLQDSLEQKGKNRLKEMQKDQNELFRKLFITECDSILDNNTNSQDAVY